jgi:hypothetical protein
MRRNYKVKFNSNRQQEQILIIGLILSSFLFLQGCGTGRNGITIDSEPQGADILADGKNIGKTPMHIKQDDVFPPHWHGRNYMVKGKLEIQKEDCDGFNMEVNDFVLQKDIKASLKCKPGAVKSVSEPAPAPEPKKMEAKEAKPASAAPAPVPVKAEPSKPAVMDEGIEQRLTKLKSLRDRGVITADEYSAQRKRILDSM